MIVIFSTQSALIADLRSELEADALKFHIAAVDPSTVASLSSMYFEGATAIVVDSVPPVAAMPQKTWNDVIASLCRRMPVVMLCHADGEDAQALGAFPEAVMVMTAPKAAEIIAYFDTCGATGRGFRKIERSGIPLYNPLVPVHMLKHYGALSVLSVNANSFQKVALEFGNEAYIRLQECFHHILFELWGASGCFRSSDILCRKSAAGNSYYVFLEQSRATSAVPAPGVLERLADRLVVRMQNVLWNELFLDKTKRMLPGCLTLIPEFAIGHASSIYNPCVDVADQVEQLLESAADTGRVQTRRMKDRQRELMLTLIQTNDLLYPNYQGVFDLTKLDKEQLDASRAQKSLKPIAHAIYGFESLIRVRKELVDAKVGSDGLIYLESKFLRPDVLFELAYSAKVVLELDQACLAQAVAHSRHLPGTLMVNILPRNLYFIERLQHLLGDRKDLMFEVSESEAISNFDLMTRVRDALERLNIGIATDDFGRGYAGLERIIKIRPDLIKLDRSLIENIHKDLPKQAFVAGLVQAAKIAQSTILAEGVELWEEAEHLKNVGIELIQGFLLHRPQSAEAILQDLQLARIEEEKQPLANLKVVA